MKTFGYVRVSTDRQADQGVSLEAQEAKIRAMATVQGVELSEVIVDGGESAKSLNRPGIEKLLAMVNSGEVKTVIVAKLDRRDSQPTGWNFEPDKPVVESGAVAVPLLDGGRPCTPAGCSRPAGYRRNSSGSRR